MADLRRNTARQGRAYRRLLDLSDRLLAGFERAGYERVDPPMLHDAVHVSLGGQSLVDLTYEMSDGLALRSDFTVPVYLLHQDRGEQPGTPRYCYCGPVFRRQSAADDRPLETLQLGIEYYGSLSRGAADTRIFANIVAAVEREISGIDIITGDVALYHALLHSLNLPDDLETRLKGLFWRPARLRRTIAALSTPAPLRADLTGAESQAEIVEKLLQTDPAGWRSTTEIAERLYALNTRANTPSLPAEAADILTQYLSISAPLRDVPGHVRQLTTNPGVETALEAFEARSQQMTHRIGPEALNFVFKGDFGRRHEYYDGFVFEIFANEILLAAGGRYDALSNKGDGFDPHPAIGGMIRPEAILTVQREQA